MKQDIKIKLTRIVCLILACMMVIGVIAWILSGCSPEPPLTEGGSAAYAKQSEADDPAAREFPVLRVGETVCAVIRPELTAQGA